MTPFGTVVKQETAVDEKLTTRKPSKPNTQLPGVSDKNERDEQNENRETETVKNESRSEFVDDDLYDAEIDDAAAHSDRDDEWVPSDAEKSSQSDAELPADVKTEKKGKTSEIFQNV